MSKPFTRLEEAEFRKTIPPILSLFMTSTADSPDRYQALVEVVSRLHLYYAMTHPGDVPPHSIVKLAADATVHQDFYASMTGSE